MMSGTFTSTGGGTWTDSTGSLSRSAIGSLQIDLSGSARNEKSLKRGKGLFLEWRVHGNNNKKQAPIAEEG